MWDKNKLELLSIARALSPDDLPRFLGDLEEIRRTAEMQLGAAMRAQPDSDVLLPVAEASSRLGISTDMPYRNDYAFTRRVVRRRLFLRVGIEKAILQNDLPPVRSDTKPTHSKKRKRLN